MARAGIQRRVVKIEAMEKDDLVELRLVYRSVGHRLRAEAVD